MQGTKRKDYVYLFGNDPDIAVAQLREQLRCCNNAYERASLIHFLTYLSDPKLVDQEIRTQGEIFLQHTYARAALLRIRQYKGHPNPWMALLPPDQKQIFKENCQKILQSSLTVDLWLGGGLGDQLETLSRLKSTLSNSLTEMRMEVVIPVHSAKALQPFLKRWWPKGMQPWRIDQERPPADHPRPYLEMMPFLALMAEQQLLKPPMPIHTNLRAYESAPTILFCWRSKIDQDEKLWAYLRSLPFSAIKAFYQDLIPWAQTNGVKVVDITRYHPEDINQLVLFEKTLDLVGDKIGSFNDTVELISNATVIASVDTSLVHLARWFNRQALLLSPKFPDGRWLEITNNPQTILKQKILYDWTDPLAELMTIVKKVF